MKLSEVSEMILFDFGAIKSGGGVQLAHNFLDFLSTKESEKYYYLLPPTGELLKYENNYKSNVIISKNFFISRAIFEYIDLRNFLKRKNISVVYTFFGAGLPCPSGVKSIVSVAYPIICYPDSPFWKYIPKSYYLKQKAKNYLRCKRISAADVIVTETEVMKNRLIKYVGINNDKIIVFPPTPSKYINECFIRHQPQKVTRVLILSSLLPHKNLWRLYEITLCLLKLEVRNFKFIVSAKRSEFERIQNALLPNDVVDNHFEFVGPVAVNKINYLYENADVMMNISDLESFSNNYMEAWKSALPQICSDRDFAREICGDSAIYVEPHQPESIAKGIMKLCEDHQLRKNLATAGKGRIKLLPSAETKFSEILRFINNHV